MAAAQPSRRVKRVDTNDNHPGELSVAIAQSHDERERLHWFRCPVASEELKQKSPHADPKARTLSDDLGEHATLLYLASSTELLATIRVNFGADTESPPHLRKAFHLEHFETAFRKAYSFTSCLFVAPAWRTPVAPKLLLGAAYKLARERGARFDFCHCPPSLVPLYERLG